MRCPGSNTPDRHSVCPFQRVLRSSSISLHGGPRMGENPTRWMMALCCSLLLACATDYSSALREPTQPRGRYEQSLDSATNACRQNPAYCVSVAGEGTVVPVAPDVTPVVPPQATAKTETAEAPTHEEPSSESSDADDSVRVPSVEERQRRRDLCRDYYDRCIQARGGTAGRKHNETQCQACYDYCYRVGFWPARANGKICRGT